MNEHDYGQFVELAYLELSQPIFAGVSFLFTESQFDEFSVPVLCGHKWNNMLLHVAEISPSVCILTRTQTLCAASLLGCKELIKRCVYLVVLRGPALWVWAFLKPFFVFRNGEEVD